MFRIISTARLNELDNLASAFPMVRAKCDRLEKELKEEQQRTEELTTAAGRDAARFHQEVTDLRERTAAEVEEARGSALRTRQQANTLIEESARRARDVERRAHEKVRELRAKIEQLEAKLPDPLPTDVGVVARYENLVGAHINLTLYVTEDPAVTWYKRVDLSLVLLCTGCGHREEETRDGVTDCPEARTSFLNDPYDGAKLRRWAQEHAETCRAVTLHAQHTPGPLPVAAG
ncbi:hypothetical protein [Streptomyces sp. ID05-18]|uniref:hypothetical protein n=1 Tax=Streptomyces sp. ID05-18 TaxID=3028662 RepID=UPI0029B51BA3|nr:hypothetical protein [Streptomyces sp. ID05-18]MDX3490960.1 hypothetical protein [Streptomyces sp. ID05-18]